VVLGVPSGALADPALPPTAPAVARL